MDIHCENEQKINDLIDFIKTGKNQPTDKKKEHYIHIMEQMV